MVEISRYCIEIRKVDKIVEKMEWNGRNEIDKQGEIMGRMCLPNKGLVEAFFLEVKLMFLLVK